MEVIELLFYRRLSLPGRMPPMAMPAVISTAPLRKKASQLPVKRPMAPAMPTEPSMLSWFSFFRAPKTTPLLMQ